MTSPYRRFPWQQESGDRAILEAVIRDEFLKALHLFDHLERRDRSMPLVGYARRRFRGARLQLSWRPSIGDLLLTWIGTEGLKGPWCARVSGRVILVGFDEHVTLLPLVDSADLTTLRDVELI